MVLLVGLALGVLGVISLVGAFLLGRFAWSGDDDKSAPPAPAPTSASPSASPRAKPTGPGDVRRLAAGLFCRDLQRRGYSYTAAVDYWRMHGQPDKMDADRNGIPCETVFSAQRVQEYWGANLPVPSAPRYEPPAGNSYLDLPSGLYCGDLYRQGYSYGDALSYWYSEGMPSRLDADENGIPCETVYPRSTVDLYW